MKFNFKKVASVLASGAMLASTIGFAAAATFPAPFDSGSAIVYGANGNVQVDMAAAVNIQTAIGKISSGIDGIPEDSWIVGTGSDKLEIGETIAQVDNYLDKDDLPILQDGEIVNEKGTAKYEQFLYFEDKSEGSSTVVYEDDGDENVAQYFKIDSGKTFARYVMEFTSNLESDVIASSILEDIDDEEITIMGKTYVITTAKNTSASAVELTLMSGANKVVISNGEELTVGGKTISVIVSSSTNAQFTIDGESTNKLDAGDTYKLSDGTNLGVSEITYQSFAGGIMQATVYMGADKLLLKNGSSLEVNGESIGATSVLISTSVSADDLSISEISVNMTAEDDLFIPIGTKLSAAEDLDEPEALFSQNWDIVFLGMKETSYETISLKKSTDSKIKLEFENYNGDEISLPLIYTNETGIYGGDKQGYGLVLNASNNITRNDYFILNTADPTDATANSKTFIVQYKGADKVTDSNAKMKFNVVGIENDKEVTLSSTGTATIKLGGTDFSFDNSTTGQSDNFGVYFTGTDYAIVSVGNVTGNYIRTRYNTLINITDPNASVGGVGYKGLSTSWEVNVIVDDTNRDGDQYISSGTNMIMQMTYSNNSDGEFGTSVGTTSALGNQSLWVSDPTDNTKSTYIDNYGIEIDYTNPSSAPASITLRIPDGIAEPELIVTSGSVTAGTTAVGGLAPIVADSAVSTVEGSNLVVVGGSCINSVAAKLLGSDSPLCGAAFTAKTTVGANGYIIDTFASPYTTGKVAMLVAGYEAADTTAAAQKVVDDSLSPDASAAAIIGPVTA